MNIKEKINRLIDFINREGKKLNYVGSFGLTILLLIAVGFGLLLLTYLPWIVGIIILGVLIYVGVTM